MSVQIVGEDGVEGGQGEVGGQGGVVQPRPVAGVLQVLQAEVPHLLQHDEGHRQQARAHQVPDLTQQSIVIAHLSFCTLHL